MSATYVAAASVEEALAALNDGARVVAGGTDLVVGARQGKSPLPDKLCAIHAIAALRHITPTSGGVELGALATHAELAASSLIRDQFTALADAAMIVGSHATRANGTIGGNVMNASPAMDTGGALVCFDAVATLVSTSGERRVALHELFRGPGATTARPDELLTRIELPTPQAGTASAYVRLEYRRQMEIAVVGASAVITQGQGRITAARIAITALAPIIHRVPAAEEALVGSDGGEAALKAAGAAIAEAARPISDVRASEEYRRAMAAVITRRAVHAALARGRGESIPIPASNSTFAA
jgi:CO/xanthine dehydrogenase FAD-binding subunit